MADEYGYKIGEILTKHYDNEQGFASAYNANARKVLETVVREMNPVPYDLKERLDETYKSLTTVKPDGYKTA